MNWLELEPSQAEERFETYCTTGEFHWDPRYNTLRRDLTELFRDVLAGLDIREGESVSSGGGRSAYLADLDFGLGLYGLLKGTYGMGVRAASSDGVWRCLSVTVVPDLVDRRYGKDHPDRFWRKGRRIWLRVLWWYIHLSWQGTAAATREVLKDNSTDEILQLVDRCGRDGYRVDLCRELMGLYGSLRPEQRRGHLFRRLMVLNTARTQVMEPALTPGGNGGYVEDLCRYFGVEVGA